MRWLRWFLAGAAAVPAFHQLALAVLYASAIVARQPFSMEPTRPFGVPQVISLAFWGGVWGLILGLILLRRTSGAAFWLTALVFGAIAPTLVAIFVAAPLKGQPAGGGATAFLIGGLLNGAWGGGTAAFYRVWSGRS